MRLLKILSISVVLLTIMSCIGFVAEGPSTYPRYVPPAPVLPSGTYSDTCSDCTIAFGELKCWCKDRNNFRNFTTISMSSCQGTFRNNAGRLECVQPLKPLPRGSYQGSCTGCTISGDVLSCSCKNVDGFSRYTSLNTRYCYDPVSNLNGNLKCGEYAPPAPPPPVLRPLPSGSYQGSCTGCTVSGDLLSCSCKNADGFSRYTSLNTRYCNDSVSNLNGSLKCGEYVPPPPPPPVLRPLPRGSYQGSCTGCTLSSDVLSCSCKNADGFSRYTSLNTRYCYDPVSNQNGSLKCGEYTPPAPPAPRPPVMRPLPRGSYQGSCTGCTMSGDMLSCSCKNEDGFSRYTSLNTGSCYSQVSNQNGNLTCGEGQASAQMPRSLPQGSYKNSCSGCSLTNNLLQCSCKDERGSSRSTTISLFGCSRSVENCNGRLTCGSC